MSYGKRRNISAYRLREMLRQESQELWLVFVTISHESLSPPIRVVCDSVDYEYGGELFTGFQFEVDLLTDNPRSPETKLRVQNVDQVIGNAVKDLINPPRVKIELIAGSDFDLTVTPRIPITIPEPVWSADHLFLIDVKGDAFELEGRVVSYNYSQEPYPANRATQQRCPGLFK